MQETSRIIKMPPDRLTAMKHHVVRTNTTLSALYDNAMQWFITYQKTHDVPLMAHPHNGKSVTLPLSREVVSQLSEIAIEAGTSQIQVIYTGINLYLSLVLELYSLGSLENV